MKGLKDLALSDRVLKERDDDQYRYSVQKARPSDSGTYWMVARNKFGTDRAFVTITVSALFLLMLLYPNIRYFANSLLHITINRFSRDKFALLMI